MCHYTVDPNKFKPKLNCSCSLIIGLWKARQEKMFFLKSSIICIFILIIYQLHLWGNFWTCVQLSVLLLEKIIAPLFGALAKSYLKPKLFQFSNFLILTWQKFKLSGYFDILVCIFNLIWLIKKNYIHFGNKLMVMCSLLWIDKKWPLCVLWEGGGVS
jgi:hypothetical protein